MVKTNTCVFISGKGTNLKKLILNSRIYNFPINIKLIISNNKNRLGKSIFKHLKIYRGPNHPHLSQKPKELEI